LPSVLSTASLLAEAQDEVAPLPAVAQALAAASKSKRPSTDGGEQPPPPVFAFNFPDVVGAGGGGEDEVCIKGDNYS
jgi:hypothetical protein